MTQSESALRAATASLVLQACSIANTSLWVGIPPSELTGMDGLRLERLLNHQARPVLIQPKPNRNTSQNHGPLVWETVAGRAAFGGSVVLDGLDASPVGAGVSGICRVAAACTVKVRSGIRAVSIRFSRVFHQGISRAGMV